MDAAPRILVVDDRESDLDLMEALLATRGYEVVRASSGSAGQRTASETRPDVVILDVMMPDLDGFEVCRRLRADPATSFLPVVLVTASQEQDRARGLEAGADDFIQKPVDRAELLARVRSLVRIKQYHDTIERQSRELAEWNQVLEARVSEQVDELARMSRLRRFLSPRLAQVLVSMNAESLLATHRSLIAVLCCHLSGFAAFAETAAPEDVVALLAEYHAVLGEVIQTVEATVGALEEDQVTIFFNDPMPAEDAPIKSVRLGLALRAHLEPLCRTWHKRGYELCSGMGIDYGYATLGTFGFEGRMEYGAIGLVRRVADGLSRRAGSAEVLVSRRAYAALGDQFAATLIGDVQIEGLPRPVEALSVQASLRPDHGSTVDERSRLSARELEVVELVARGMSNHQIAEQLVVSERTVEAHVAHICAKLDLRSRVQAAAWAIEHGLAHTSR